MQIKFQKLHPDAVVPKYAKSGDAGADLTAVSCEWDNMRAQWHYGTGLAVEIPEGFVGLLFPRSSIYKTGGTLTNCVGVLDSGYRGEIKAIFQAQAARPYNVGDRIIQLVITPIIRGEFVEVEQLGDSERGISGFGSTGIN